jgi:septal ring factor EnvC (AmiA/AmiB activator)
MSATAPALSVATLFQEREAQRRKDREAEEQLQRRRQEELAAFRKRLDEFELTNERVEAAISRVKAGLRTG